MPVSPEHIVGRWLRKMGIIISPSLLKEQLNSHPDYPSLRSISDCLDNLGIDNAALVIDKERLNEVPLPFLAHDMARNRFIIIENTIEQISENTEFNKHWNGTALLAEKPEGWRNEENEKQIKAGRKKNQNTFFAVSLIILLVGLSLLNGFSWQMAGLLVTVLAGLGIAALIVQHELGISNEITEQLCSTGKNTDCDAVMHSKGSKLGKWLSPIAIGWADAGIIFFSSFLVTLVVAIYTGYTAVTGVLAVLSAAAIPFTFFSLYYQWRVIKKWCPLCLLTIAVLWLQFFLLFPALEGLIIDFIAAAFTSFVFISTAIIWLLLVKPALEKNKEFTDNNFRLLRFKNNYLVFEGFLYKQRKIDVTPFENDLQLGNPDAPVQIMVACNPYCWPCAKTHEVLHEFACKTDIGFTIRLTPKTNNREDKTTIAAEYLLQLLNGKGGEYKRQALHDWYSWMDVEKFKKQYVLSEINDVKVQLKQHEDWNREAKIEFTPTIFINGYELPKQYKATDLKNIIKNVEQNIETAVAETELTPA
ncbi:MAG TPA: vitamin K epoxide reductase family protein [Chitinophagaceae bacterium]|nr:vitamin K epoxide reductase family protein [Chitinophagaceae bacterium]